MAIKVGINGFGRIGRNFLRASLKDEEFQGRFEIIAVNDLTNAKTLGHLLKYDSAFGRFPKEVETKEEALLINGRKVKVLAERDPAKLSWKELGVEIVLESTGLFTKMEDCKKHIKAGAKKVILSARYKGDAEDAIMINIGINEKDYNPKKHHIISMASCTTNSFTPMMKVINKEFGVEKALMTTIHSYTNDQNVLDAPHKDLRRARTAAHSIIPTTTNAAIAVAQVIPELKGKFDGMAVRVPTIVGSISDATIIVKRNTSREEVNKVLKAASEGELKGILGYTEEPLVSCDIIGSPYSSIVDALSTKVMGGNMVKVLTWYDNEWGYSCRIVDLIKYIWK